MSPGEPSLYFLPETALEQLMEASAGGLVPRLVWQEGSSPFQVRDSFDQGLRGSGRLLIEAEDRVELLRPEGAPLVQPGTPGGRFVTDLPEGPVKDALSDLSPLRCLLPVGAGTLRRGTLSLLDDEGKTQARALLFELAATEGGTALGLQVQGLRGYDKALLRLRGMVEDAGGGRARRLRTLYRALPGAERLQPQAGGAAGPRNQGL
ncbi:hypothetical protein CLG85_007735 [Yangia mangrovi]|uniref:Uncharacterized protein n=1 Tax=Alloyangia mangrovi TaxID=1779329 RepID=A0ABT2KJD0_9RHOB|nr:hypothetical protein [Alloyangia mangrovi]MCT4370221.1 hypothetical protein [Alloyangia mangrovi]